MRVVLWLINIVYS